jgi:hypothetical protein
MQVRHIHVHNKQTNKHRYPKCHIIQE